VPRGAVEGLLATVGSAAVGGLYLWIINGEGEGELGSSRVLFIAACIFVSAGLSLVGALLPDPWARLVLRATAACMLVVLTLLGAMSIGILLLIPTLLSLRSTAHATLDVPRSAAWPIVAGTAVMDVAVVALGVASTS